MRPRQPDEPPPPLQIGHLRTRLLARDPQYLHEEIKPRIVERIGLPQPRRHAWDVRQKVMQKIDEAKEEAVQIQNKLATEPLSRRERAEVRRELKKLQARPADLTQRLERLGLTGSEEEIRNYNVRYLHTEAERAPYRVRLGKKLVGETAKTNLDTTKMFSYGEGEGFAAFVLSPQGELYVGEHRIQRFHHSSFLAGGEVRAAGEIKVKNGKVVAITNKSGHYKPTDEHMLALLDHLARNKVPLSGVKLSLLDSSDWRNVKTIAVPDAEKWRLQQHENLLKQQRP